MIHHRTHHWSLNDSKWQLIEQEKEYRNEKAVVCWQPWAVTLLRDENPNSLVLSLENKVEKIAKESKMMLPDGNVSLVQLCNYLNVEVSWEPNGSTGVICRKDGKWHASIYRKTKIAARETLAHELGHAILYHRPNGGVYEYDWNNSTNSPIEEALCTYAARIILLPEEEIRRIAERASKKKKRKRNCKNNASHKNVSQNKVRRLTDIN